MRTELDMNIPVELLGLSDIEIQSIYLRNHDELVIEVKSTQDDTCCRNCGRKCKDHGYDGSVIILLSYAAFFRAPVICFSQLSAH